MIVPPDHMPDLRRLHWFIVVLVLAFLMIVVRLWYLQILQGAEMETLSETQRSRLIRRLAARGEILDCKGRILASSRSHFVVSVMPEDLRKNPDVVPRLAAMLHMPAANLQRQIEYDTINSFDPVPVAADVDMNLLSQIEEQHTDLSGVLISKEPVRTYLDNQLCTHVLGVTRPISAEMLKKMKDRGYHGGDMIGMEGLEKSFEMELRGHDGGQRVEVDARGRMRRNIDSVAPVTGHTLRLTLDKDLQKVAYDSLQAQLAKGHPGSAVAIDPRDGAVLAMVSVPTYDLNRYGTDYSKLLRDKNRPLINRAANSAYPCGSTFKLITAAAGLSSGAIGPYSTEYCSGSLRLGRRIFHCDKRSGHGSLDFEHAIGYSCDVYFWRVAMRTGQEELAKWARNFGVGSKTGIDLPASPEAAGRVPTDHWKRRHGWGPWVQGDTLNMAIGQGFIGVTPLQLADYTAALANGGNLMRPQLVRETLDSSTAHPRVLSRLKPDVRAKLGLKEEYRRAIVAGMRRAMEGGGTAAGSAIPGLEIAGKTGTAEAIIHHQKASHSVFVCFAPINNPKIAIAVLVEGGGFGADVAAPIAHRMLAQYFHLGSASGPVAGHHYGRD